MTVDFLDILAWLHCPMAAQAGYVPRHPRGDPELAVTTIEAWPNDTLPLTRFTPNRKQATTWLQGTRFGVQNVLVGPSAPPQPTSPETGYWISEGRRLPWTGVINIPGVSYTLPVIFRLPYLHQIAGRWEIVLFDTSSALPTLQRRSDLMVEAAFLADCFRLLTGQQAGLRLIAPALAQEEVLEPPLQHLDSLIRLVDVIRPIGFIRPGAYCNESDPSRSTTASKMTREWRCPVREAGNCYPFFPPNSPNAHAGNRPTGS